MNEKRREWTPTDQQAAMRIELVYVKKPWPGFDAAVQEYRQIEAELVEQDGDDEFMVLETKRRIAEWILTCAWRDDVPFEQFQEAWNAMVALGFSGDDIKRTMTWHYADYCLTNKHYDVGLTVLEPVVAEFEEWLQGIVLKPKMKTFYEDELEGLRHKRDGLIALRKGGAEAEAWLARERARAEARRPSPQKERQDKLRSDLIKAMKPIRATSAERSFTEIEQAMRQVETDFLARLQPDDHFWVPQLKQRITNAIFTKAHELRQPFEVCRDLWNELSPWDFGHLEHRCEFIWMYGDCCLFNQQPDAGLAVVEPLLAELQRQVDTGTDDEMGSDSYPEEITRLEKLRDELKALPQ
jgi:hypothetical protein